MCSVSPRILFVPKWGQAWRETDLPMAISHLQAQGRESHSHIMKHFQEMAVKCLYEGSPFLPTKVPYRVARGLTFFLSDGE